MTNDKEEIPLKVFGIKDNQGNWIDLNPPSEHEQKVMQVQHYQLNLPATMTKDQLKFILDIARWVGEKQPITIIHNIGVQKFLRWSMLYKNICIEFDEEQRWTDEDEGDFQKLMTEFKPMADWIMEQYHIKMREKEY